MDSNLSLLGIARKAGLLTVGEESVGAAARTKKARAILSASDASERSMRQARGFSEAYGMPYLPLPYTKDELGAVTGRGSPAMLALTDAGIAAKLAARLAVGEPDKYAVAAEALAAKSEKINARRTETLRHKRNIRTGKRR
ncbi:MAG: 50S ribosomal protein L7 [Oscillospiraceae bacterium]|jgi:ribosomal protein L7Ae-like RNA K-turn-binding protein|nr:50S ribosomal protein L7 [Oscillospiraceae bacterium]